MPYFLKCSWYGVGAWYYRLCHPTFRVRPPDTVERALRGNRCMTKLAILKMGESSLSKPARSIFWSWVHYGSGCGHLYSFKAVKCWWHSDAPGPGGQFWRYMWYSSYSCWFLATKTSVPIYDSEKYKDPQLDLLDLNPLDFRAILPTAMIELLQQFFFLKLCLSTVLLDWRLRDLALWEPCIQCKQQGYLVSRFMGLRSDFQSRCVKTAYLSQFSY